MMTMKSLGELAILVRSKNAGPFWYTFDIMFQDYETYRIVRDSGIVSKQRVADIYKQDEKSIILVNHDDAFAVKVSFPRKYTSGSRYDSDIFGGAQYAPLLDLEIPMDGKA